MAKVFTHTPFLTRFPGLPTPANYSCRGCTCTGRRILPLAILLHSGSGGPMGLADPEPGRGHAQENRRSRCPTQGTRNQKLTKRPRGRRGVPLACNPPCVSGGRDQNPLRRTSSGLAPRASAFLLPPAPAPGFAASDPYSNLQGRRIGVGCMPAPGIYPGRLVLVNGLHAANDPSTAFRVRHSCRNHGPVRVGAVAL